MIFGGPSRPSHSMILLFYSSVSDGIHQRQTEFLYEGDLRVAAAAHSNVGSCSARSQGFRETADSAVREGSTGLQEDAKVKSVASSKQK